MTNRLDAASKARQCEIESGPRRSLQLQQPYHCPVSKTEMGVVEGMRSANGLVNCAS